MVKYLNNALIEVASFFSKLTIKKMKLQPKATTTTKKQTKQKQTQKIKEQSEPCSKVENTSPEAGNHW